LVDCYIELIETNNAPEGKTMKRYSICSADFTRYAQFPALDKPQAVEQAKRHAEALGISGEDYRVSYRGKWAGDDNPTTYAVAAA
jgi:hypothetical protein